VTHAQVISLLNRIASGGYDFIKTEGLYMFDGERGFSLDQGE
jgi:isocitrate dehydrogenase